MRGLMAVSRDGYLCRDENDDMTWTGSIDKALFRLLTVGQSDNLYAGKRTAAMMPPLPGRRVVPIVRDVMTEKGVQLNFVGQLRDHAWLIGGPTIMRAALDAGYITHLHLVCVPHVLGGGIPVTVLGHYVVRWPDHVIEIPPVKIRIWRFHA
jgi:dihydrofolate reductase